VTGFFVSAAQRLVSAHCFSENWPTWEIHPEGDELVVLLSASAEFKLRLESGDQSVQLRDPGAFLVVPRNTWLTVLVHDSASVLFTTPVRAPEMKQFLLPVIQSILNIEANPDGYVN